MDDDRFLNRAGIDEWYVGMVEEGVKAPLRRHLAERIDFRDTKIILSYGVTLTGLNTTRAILYEIAGIPNPPAHLKIDEILEEIRGCG